jgi:3'-phosphoadenosine 5'-phosphosulfate sulfotransferase (PAPS reductase)/FAD synthetase
VAQVSGQLELVAPPTPEELFAEAELEHGPFAARFALVSGGSDSTVLAHRCRHLYDELVFIDTGTALPGVRDHVERIAALVDAPLLVYEAGVQWRAMILGGEADPARPGLRAFGFPGPGQHGVAYNRLKLRQVERLVREHKTRRGDRIALLTGVRKAESARRAWNMKHLVRRNGAQVWLAPLVFWTGEQMADYRDEHALPLSDVAALLHRSGECNCGCYQAEDREMLAALWPEWWEATIGSLERRAAELGLPTPKWGGGLGAAGGLTGELCSDCQLTLEVDE